MTKTDMRMWLWLRRSSSGVIPPDVSLEMLAFNPGVLEGIPVSEGALREGCGSELYTVKTEK